MTVLNRDKILEAARELVEQGKIDKAIKEYEKLIAVDPQDMRVRLRVAELLVKRKQTQEAIQIYQEVAEHYTQGGFFLKAVTIFKNILRLNPSLLEVNISLAQLYEKMGLGSDAVHQYEIIALAYEQNADFEKALEVRKKMTQLAPKNASYRVRYAECLQREGQHDMAIEQYEHLARQLEAEGGQEKERVDLYEKILPSHPENVDILRSLVLLQYKKGEIKEALKWLEKSKRFVLDHEDLLEVQAKIYAELNQLETARSYYQQLAELHLKKGISEKALEAYCEILTLLPEEGDNLRPVIENIQSGAFERLQKRALLQRQKREEIPPKEPEPKPVPKKEEKIEKKVQTKPKEVPVKAVTPVLSGSTEELLKRAQGATELFKAYQQMGLESEAVEEKAQAKECLEKILVQDPQSSVAQDLLRRLEESPAPEKPKVATPPPVTVDPVGRQKKGLNPPAGGLQPPGSRTPSKGPQAPSKGSQTPSKGSQTPGGGKRKISFL